jgi:hypothetical protein
LEPWLQNPAKLSKKAGNSEKRWKTPSAAKESLFLTK